MASLFLQPIITGFLVKSIASFDDTLTRIPILATFTRSRKGKVAFSIGTLLALTLVLSVAIFFSEIMGLIPFRQQVMATLILILAFLIYFGIFFPKTEAKLQQRLVGVKPISNERFIKLVGVGFTVALITLLDDMVILVPLFLGDNTTKFFALIGVYLAALLQISLVIYFSRQIEKIQYKKEVASLAMVTLAIFVWFGIV